MHSEIFGFDQNELNFIANIARYHEKKALKKDPEILNLDSRKREVLKILTTLVRLGESPDRSHAALIQQVRFSRAPEISRNALPPATRVTADTAGLGDQVLSPEGLLAYAAIHDVFGPDELPGIFRNGERTVVFIPTYISHTLHQTTGLGTFFHPLHLLQTGSDRQNETGLLL